MNKLLLSAMIVATTSSMVAGDWGKAPVDKTPIEECVDLGGEISVGYETDYIFNGIRFARDSVWADVNYTYEGLPVPVTIGTWYLNGIDGSAFGAGYDELRLYASAELGSFAGFDFTLGYTHYIFPEFRSNFIGPDGGYGEIGLDISRSLGWFDIAWESNYAMGGGGFAPRGWYHQFGVEKSFGLTDSISLVLGAGIGYSDNYFAGAAPNFRDSGWNHYYAKASLPIQLNCRTVLTPYIGYNGSPDTFVTDGFIGANEPQSDILHGGVTLSVSF